MSDLPVRLALVGPPDDIALDAFDMRRVLGGQVTVIADSMEAASHAEVEFDAVVVHSSDDAHDAAKSGKHILVDAPVADSTEQAQSLIESVEQAGLVLKVGRMPRHAPANLTIMDRLSSGKLGDAGLLRVHRWSSNKEQSLAAKMSIYYRDQPPSEFKSQRLLASDNDYLLADDFVRAIETNTPAILDARTSRNITATVAAAIESGRSGKVVEVC